MNPDWPTLDNISLIGSGILISVFHDRSSLPDEDSARSMAGDSCQILMRLRGLTSLARSLAQTGPEPKAEARVPAATAYIP
jgi:hypothetical protein